MFKIGDRCIPYRIKSNKGKNLEDSLEVLVISAQRKGKGMLFPKVLHHLNSYNIYDSNHEQQSDILVLNTKSFYTQKASVDFL